MIDKLKVSGHDNYDFPKTRAALNQLVADISQLSVNIHQTHWYMRGKEFFRLHPLMDDYMDQLAEQLDQIAERLIEIGGAPYSTTREFIDHTGLPEETGEFGKYTLEDYMERLVNQYEYLRDVFQQAMLVSDEEKDWPTQDMLNGMKELTDKNIWMLNAFLGKGPFGDK
ncbi:ferritin Dps family protein [Agrilactobacillus composti DSM 18527 = JCM 14202]|jgi:starvation-inducible DNA-binding protein|uniref:Ferritin Dps family protein n=1 Tax=Agrilactobacillus composti DSM 18527 = JCM 14202 TaxID=1423734 RepID=X0PP14_9LACO|nr:Dps family protein [Agrilactobacillus composti]KRM31616.1 ferritin Dps family protein [Agrilactobacillus composti DSM 18527 = JCM 14202]MCH4172322.1 DNA starvation/stationary phase protection protein [Lactobacillus sp.]GAF39352.1 non-specific DNA-binding protein Dps [Agrilactobacillus composti DSM 18527 = JCM 14202]